MTKFSWFDSSSFHPDIKTNKNGYLLILVSHIAILIPIYIAVILHKPMWFIVLLTIQFIFSFLYHSFNKITFFRASDWILAQILGISLLIVIISDKKLSNIKVLALFLLVILAIKPFLSFKNYSYNHSLWHVIVSLITTIIIF